MNKTQYNRALIDAIESIVCEYMNNRRDESTFVYEHDDFHVFIEHVKQIDIERAYAFVRVEFDNECAYASITIHVDEGGAYVRHVTYEFDDEFDVIYDARNNKTQYIICA
jgi:hypothetical protein